MNPYWKDGGSGLPPSSSVKGNNDGRSWILRSYKRALEQAKEKNISFEEIAEKQWGSIEKIHSLLRSVGIDPAKPDDLPVSEKKNLFSFPKNDETTAMPSGFNYLIKTGKKLNFLCPGEGCDVDTGIHSNWQMKKETKDAPTKDEDKKEEYSFQEDRSSISDDIVTDTMINSTSAKLIKAELVGNTKKIQEVRQQLDVLRSRKKIQDSTVRINKGPSHDVEKVVLLTTTDRFGRVKPAEMPVYKPDFGISKGKGKKGKSKHISDDISLQTVVEQEHRLTADDTYEAIANMASKFVRSNPDDVVDDVLDQSIKSKLSNDEKKRKKVFSENRKMDEILDRCKFCFNSSYHREHLLIAVGINIYLCVPSHQSLTDGHCLLVPVEHVTSSLQLDENVWNELKIFQKGLTRMFSDFDMDVIFTECCTSSTKRSHMCIECIPVPKEEGSMAPMYFKKAIQESDCEWAQNKKLIDTRQKGVKNSIPLGLPYFYVDFNNEGGFAHVIEDPSLFPNYFAKEVIGGLIDAEPRLWLKPQHEDIEQQKKKKSKLKDMWIPYDWTKQLGH